MYNHSRYLILSACLCGAAVVQAQKPINQDVSVVRDYTPTVMDVSKLEQMPTLDDTTTYNPTFNYSILSRAFETNKEIEPISPAKLAADKKPMLTNSLAKVGLGTYSSALAELNYNLLRSKEYALGLDVAHQTSWGTVELEDQNKVDAPFHDTHAGLRFKRFFDQLTLSTNLGFTHNLFDYYGYQTMEKLTNYSANSQTVKGNALLPETSQRFGLFNLGLGVGSTETGKNASKWNTAVGFSSFGNRTGVHQNKVDVIGNLAVPMSSFGLLVDAGLSTYKVTVPENDVAIPYYTFDASQRTVITLNSRLAFPFDGGRVEAGLLIVSEMGSENDEVKLAPHLTGRLDIADGIVSVFGGFSGKYNDNDYASVAYENPFVAPDANLKNSFYGLDLHGGLKGSFSSSTSFTARVDYSFFTDEHFFVNRTWAHATNPNTIDYVNQFDVVYDDGTLLKVAGELFINPSDAFNLRFDAAYFGWELDNEAKAWHKPDMRLGVSGIYKPNSDWMFETNLGYVGMQYAKVPDLAPEKELKGYFDANLSANYKLAKQWTLWGRLNNVAAAEYYRWNGYPSQKINLMLGMAYSF